MSIQTATNGSFKKPKGFFSQISNTVLRDEYLSLKAKGLYSLITSYITLPNFTLYKNYLMSQCSEGRHAFDSTWKELVGAGYLEHSRSRLEDGTFIYQYSLSAPSSKTETIPDEKNRQIEETPVAENQTPVTYIDNKTLNNNTKSISLTDPDIIEKVKEQIDYDFFETGDGPLVGSSSIIAILLDFLIELHQSQPKLVQLVDSCVLMDFIEHMKHRSRNPITHPIPYWRASFANYLKEQALVLAVV